VQAVINELQVVLNAVSARQAKVTAHTENLWKCSSTTLPHTPMTALSMEQLTWYFVHIQMGATSTKINLAAEQVHISSSRKTIQHHASTARPLQ
jgi:hypothetical protein